MLKILYIMPHLSTGGGPQVGLLTFQEMLNLGHDVYVIDYTDFPASNYIIQKDKIRDLVGDDKLYSLPLEEKESVLSIVDNVSPDIVHIHEMAESFISDRLLNILYRPDRKYKIFETSHNSVFDMSKKRVLPDGFVFINETHKNSYGIYDTDSIIWFPEFSRFERPDRSEALLDLGLDPLKKHVVNVGLFQPIKNQAEVFKYARKFPDVSFHFIGNTAPNFKDYWEPLLNNKPENCKLWGERYDVEKFFGSMDLHLFTSRPYQGMSESMPVVLRESVQNWGQKTLFYNNPRYDGIYDNEPSVKYLTENFDNNCELIREVLYGT